MQTLRSQSATGSGARGSRILLTGSTYGSHAGTVGYVRPRLTGEANARQDERVQALASYASFTSASGLNRALLTGSTYGVFYNVGLVRPALYVLRPLGGVTDWTIDAVTAIAWPLIDFHEHTHVIDDWQQDGLLNLDWQALADPPWEFSVEASSTFTWALTVNADWRINMDFDMSAELGVSHKITDWTVAGAFTAEFDALRFAGVDDWEIDATFTLKWVTFGDLKDGICIIATDDQVGVAPLASAGGAARNMLF